MFEAAKRSTYDSNQASTHRALPLNYVLAPVSGAWWRASVHAGLSYRDLNLAEASDGQMSAQVLRAESAGRLAVWADVGISTFRCVYLLGGELRFKSAEGESVLLGPGDVAYLDVLKGASDIAFSADFTAIELATPALGRRIDRVDPLLQFPALTPEEAKATALNRESEDAYVLGDGPRSYFGYRDIGTAAVTGRRIHIHVLRTQTPPPAGGTGWHDHSMSQLFFVLKGKAVVSVEHHGATTMNPGDAMCIPAGIDHDVPELSDDYTVFEICMPGDYTTIPQQRG